MGGICHIVIFLLLTSQFIRWLLGSLENVGLFISEPLLSLFLFICQFKEELKQKPKNKIKQPFRITEKEGVNDKKDSAG